MKKRTKRKTTQGNNAVAACIANSDADTFTYALQGYIDMVIEAKFQQRQTTPTPPPALSAPTPSYDFTYAAVDGARDRVAKALKELL